ncbi:MAG TPA: class I SAM-dependent methyltransferase [Candidatus Udaeobacter sp.]
MSFDRLAPHYRWLETVGFGSVLQKARTRWIETVPRPKRVLTVGEGTGHFLRKFLRVHRDAVVDCVDSSARMLEFARLRIPDGVNRVRFFEQDILSWTPPGCYDLVVTHFVLDCFPQNELKLIVQKLAGLATPGAYWLLADFCIPKTSFARVHAKIWLAILYWFFRTTTAVPAKRLVDPTPELQANGFVCLERSQWRLGLVKSELWQNARA